MILKTTYAYRKTLQKSAVRSKIKVVQPPGPPIPTPQKLADCSSFPYILQRAAQIYVVRFIINSDILSPCVMFCKLTVLAREIGCILWTRTQH